MAPITLGGFRWVDPLTAFGELSSYVLITSIIIIIGFSAAALFIFLYNKKFYGVGEVPKGWKTFFSGLILSSLYQLLKIPYTYEWIFGDVLTLIFLVFQVIAVGVLVYGLYLMKKEIVIK